MHVVGQRCIYHQLVEIGRHYHGADVGELLIAGALQVGIAPFARQSEMGLRVVVHVRVEVYRRYHLQASAGHVRWQKLGTPGYTAVAGANLNQAIGAAAQHYGRRTTRPSILPSVSPLSTSLTSLSDRSAIGGGTILPARRSAIKSARSCGVPTCEPRSDSNL